MFMRLVCNVAIMLVVVSIEARLFHNPILSGKSYNRPSALKYNDTYYLVSGLEGSLPVYTSSDLIEWTSAGSILDGSSLPAWARSKTLYTPYMHQSGHNFLLYFAAINTTHPMYQLGVAIAPHPLGPYSSIDRPIVTFPNAWYPSIIDDKGKLYLLWAFNSFNFNARQLNENGLSFSSEEVTTLLKPSLDWEGGQVAGDIWSPWYYRRGSYHYIFYSSGCKIGVARSTHSLGPYEKLPDPIITSNGNQDCYSDPSVVKDMNDISDVIFFGASKNGSSAIVLASFVWDEEDWPSVGPF